MQQSFVVISWNVLHMVHEINYAFNNSPVIMRYSINEKWSNEKLRLNDMVKTLSELLIKHSSIECFICLQEVPADLLPLLRTMLDSHVGSVLTTRLLMHVQTYPRKPSVRGRQTDGLYTDSNECLVIIHHDPRLISPEKTTQSTNATASLQSTDQFSWTPCPIDGGKGALAVTTATGLTIVNAHVPYNTQAADRLLENISWPENNSPFVFVGDINCSSPSFMKKIAEITAGKPSAGLLFPVTTQKATRVGLREDGRRDASWIDHYVISAALKPFAVTPVVVYDDIGDISDHFPISLQFKEM